VKPDDPTLVRERFRAVVERGIQRAAREHQEHLDRIKALPRLPPEGHDEFGHVWPKQRRAREC
jgi:hypothetical protein